MIPVHKRRTKIEKIDFLSFSFLKNYFAPVKENKMCKVALFLLKFSELQYI